MAGSKVKVAAESAGSASELIVALIAELDDWRGETLAHIRHLRPFQLQSRRQHQTRNRYP